MTDLQTQLFTLQDLSYQKFHAKLIPNVAPQRVIGVRMPALRKLAKELAGREEAERFLQELPHTYYEENNLHGLLIGQKKDFFIALSAQTAFLPYIDNWATCDLPVPKIFAKHREELLPHIQHWLTDHHPYTIRYAIGLLLSLYLDEAFRPEYLQWVAAVTHEDYYVRMMQAWYFATALAKQYDTTLLYLTEHRLTPWIHNKTIQKAVESYRITPDQKAFLKTLRWKGSAHHDHL